MLKVSDYSSNILHNINFHLKENENLIVLGSNGAGKSTLAKVLCGILDSDSVSIFEKNLHHLTAKDRAKQINYIPPKLEMFDEYISLEEYLGLSKLYSDSSVSELIELLGLVEIKNKSCNTLSSGEQQLTMIASAILHNAKITIFDEPTANLDPKKTLKVYEILRGDKIQHRIIITHDLNLAYKLGYKVLYILDGRIEFFDNNEEFFKNDNLHKLFGSALKRIDNYFVVNL